MRLTTTNNVVDLVAMMRLSHQILKNILTGSVVKSKRIRVRCIAHVVNIPIP